MFDDEPRAVSGMPDGLTHAARTAGGPGNTGATSTTGTTETTGTTGTTGTTETAPTAPTTRVSTSSGAAVAPLSTSDLRELVVQLAGLGGPMSEGELVERIHLLERIKGACAAAQARAAVALDQSRRDAEEARGVARGARGRGVADEIALARMDAKVKGSRHLGLAKALAQELPHTQAALTAGVISEWRATLVCRETAWLAPDLRREVDARLAARLPRLGDRAVERTARTLAQQLDPAGAVQKMAGEPRERRVTLRPAPDAMSYLTAYLPVAQGVAAYAALDRAARTPVVSDGGAGEPDARERGLRSRGQVMADTLVERLTGQARADDVSVEIQLVMTDRSLFDTGDVGSEASARIPGQGTIPAEMARRLIAADRVHPGHGSEAVRRSQAWIRRLFASPASHELVAMDRERRRFDGLLRSMIVIRDDTCRTPWCDAPIRHADHVNPVHAGGRTTFANGAGLCARCNYTKELHGWSARVVEGPRHSIEVRTPTGFTYRSTAPPLPIADPALDDPPARRSAERVELSHPAARSVLEGRLERLLAA